jgi:hypothetical protein
MLTPLVTWLPVAAYLALALSGAHAGWVPLVAHLVLAACHLHHSSAKG